MNRIYNAYMVIKGWASRSAVLFPFIVRLMGWRNPLYRNVIVTRETEIVIDGFPRSANTFFVSAFEVAQGREVRIARHLHEAYQIKFAERHGIPAVILVRSPVEAVVSACLRDPRQSPRRLLKEYAQFYRECLRAHRRAVIAPFETVTRNPNAIIDRVNQTYGTRFALLPPESSEAVAAEVKSKDDRVLGEAARNPLKVALPTAEKARKSKELTQSLKRRYAGLIHVCQEIHQQVLYKASAVCDCHSAPSRRRRYGDR